MPQTQTPNKEEEPKLTLEQRVEQLEAGYQVLSQLLSTHTHTQDGKAVSAI